MKPLDLTDSFSSWAKVARFEVKAIRDEEEYRGYSDESRIGFSRSWLASGREKKL